MQPKELPLEVIVQLSPFVERMRISWEIIQDIETQLQPMANHASIEQIQEHLDITEKYAKRSKQTLAQLNQSGFTDHITIAIRELMTKRIKASEGICSYWRNVLSSRLS